MIYVIVFLIATYFYLVVKILKRKKKIFKKILIYPSNNKDALFDRIEHEYLFDCFNFVVDGCFLISNTHKYYI